MRLRAQDPETVAVIMSHDEREELMTALDRAAPALPDILQRFHDALRNI